MTTTELELLIYHFRNQTPHPDIGNDEVNNAVNTLLGLDLITKDEGGNVDDTYDITNKGHAHLEQLCNIPLPILKWVNTDGIIIG